MAIASVGENPRPQLDTTVSFRIRLLQILKRILSCSLTPTTVVHGKHTPQYGQLEMVSLKSKPNLSSLPTGKTQACYDPPPEDRTCCITLPTKLLPDRFPHCSLLSLPTLMLLALKLATRPARIQAYSASSLLDSMLALPEDWGST